MEEVFVNASPEPETPPVEAPKTFECSVCKMTFKHRIGLIAHMKKHRPKLEKATPPPKPATDVEEGAAGIKFFSELDIGKAGKPTGEYPFWYFTVHMENMQVEIERMENTMKMGLATGPRLLSLQKELKDKKEKYDKMQENMPRFSGKQVDYLVKMSQEFGEQIRDGMFTRTEMMKGVADAHEEARRMTEGVITIKPHWRPLLQASNIRVDERNGKVSRTGLEKVWKMCRKAIGEPSNTEALRKD